MKESMEDCESSVERSVARFPWSRVLSISFGLVSTIALSYLVPPLHSLRPWVPGDGYVPFWNVIGREWMGEGEELRREAAALALPASRRPSEPQRLSDAEAQEKREALTELKKAGPVFPKYDSPEEVGEPQWGIEGLEALSPYYRKLALVDLGLAGAIARTGHWGDSVLGVDGITSKIRNRLQARFGDAGHGFHLISRYNPSYRQEGIEFTGGGQWNRCLVVFECRKKDHRYGYGGLTADSNGGGMGRWGTTKKGFGSSASRFELWYAKQKQGGKFIISVDGKDREEFSTQGDHLQDAWHEIRVEPGQHQFTVRAAGGGNVRAYGIVMENDGPGVVWDGMAHIGGSSRGIRTQGAEHIKSQIRHRDVDLIVFMYGGNDMERGYVDLKESMQPYYDEYGEAIAKYRAGKPGLACMVMSLSDHGKRLPSGEIQSRKFAKVLAEAQREVAKQSGCAFFDTYNATGGLGTAARWFRARPRLLSPDLGHPSPYGHELIAQLLTQALLFGYEDYRRKMTGEPLPELEAVAEGIVMDPGGAEVE